MTDEELRKLKDGSLVGSFGDTEPILDANTGKRRWSFGPYVKLRDFNRQGADDFSCEDSPPHSGVEVGLRFTF